MIVFAFISFLLLYAGWRLYSSFIEKTYNVVESEKVPSLEFSDGFDYVPTNKWIVLGHHFSSIAGAGPIVGPIIASVYFGWLPAILWIIFGTIFIGAVHDYSSLIISIRHKGKSIAEIANLYIDRKTYKVFLVFIWFALMYVVAVFADITADTFSKEPSVSQISICYILIAFVFGLMVYRYRIKNYIATLISLFLIVGGIFWSLKYSFLVAGKGVWIYILLVYAFLASVLPVWILLQPRDYLSSYLLYFSVLIGVIGLFFGNYGISYPSFVSFKSEAIGNLFPFLFVTIACGAISGFHSLVASGTTSKQIDSIKNARFIGYGGMILEAIVAVIALATVMIMGFSRDVYNLQPAQIYAMGVSKFCSILGISDNAGKTTGFLILSAFVLTTLDTATRIARYIFEELFEIKGKFFFNKVLSTFISLIIPFLLLNLKIKDASGTVVPCWKMIWPIFGITNQLLAALVLVITYLWAKKLNISKSFFILFPAVFMLVVTMYALSLKVIEFVSNSVFNLVFYIGTILLILAIFIVYKTITSITASEDNVGTSS